MKQNTIKPYCDICLSEVETNAYLWSVRLPFQNSNNREGNCNIIKNMDICICCYKEIQKFIFDMQKRG